jgi:hypothetical protein
LRRKTVGVENFGHQKAADLFAGQAVFAERANKLRPLSFTTSEPVLRERP